MPVYSKQRYWRYRKSGIYSHYLILTDFTTCAKTRKNRPSYNNIWSRNFFGQTRFWRGTWLERTIPPDSAYSAIYIVKVAERKKNPQKFVSFGLSNFNWSQTAGKQFFEDRREICYPLLRANFEDLNRLHSAPLELLTVVALIELLGTVIVIPLCSTQEVQSGKTHSYC